MKKLFLNTVFILFYIAFSAQRPGDLVTQFADDGIFLAEWENTSSIIFDIAVLPDGNIMVSGVVNSEGAEKEDMLVMNLNAQGKSVAFGNSPRGFKHNINTSTDISMAITVMPDNTILVAGMYIFTLLSD
ncbi:MAG: hypothetical protein JXB00_02645 [Bacteroidales bacterium]|nr:hypothetical protein [Bacteroidales bacterium]